jgi:hypothetical protein
LAEVSIGFGGLLAFDIYCRCRFYIDCIGDLVGVWSLENAI